MPILDTFILSKKSIDIKFYKIKNKGIKRKPDLSDEPEVETTTVFLPWKP
jgi:hypothetical protein